MLRTRTRFLLGLLVGATAAGASLTLLPERGDGKWDDDARAMVPLMHAFTQALTHPPSNEDAAPEWRPLLSAGDSPTLSCALCHGDSGARMDAAIAGGELKLDAQPAELERDEMVRLMERWTRQLNRHARDRLGKAVHCLDCHETDPRD